MGFLEKKVQLEDKSFISYRHYQLGSEKICFMFSGAGYTYDSPALYYATLLLLEKNYDIIQIHYSNVDKLQKLSVEELPDRIFQMVNPVVEEEIKNNHYSEYVFFGKSLGTIPIILEYMKQSRFHNATWILLTPVLKLESITQSLLDSKQVGYIAIGDVDPQFDVQTIEKLKHKHFKLDIIPRANHSLNIEGNVAESIKVIEKLLYKINELI